MKEWGMYNRMNMQKEPIFELSGVVEKGQELGIPIGFPTANIPLHSEEFSGTYAGVVIVGEKEYPSAIYANQNRHLLESHLLDFSGNLYGQEITVRLFEKLEASKAFRTEAERTEFIDWAVRSVREYFSQANI